MSKSNYFLHVDLLVETDEKGTGGNVPKYEVAVLGAVKVLEELELVDRLGQPRSSWKLRLALKAVKPFQYQSPGSGGVQTDAQNTGLKVGRWYRRYVHLWDVPDPPDIADVMERIPDESGYSSVSGLLAREVQCLVVGMGPEKLAATTLGARFVELRRACVVKNLGRIAFRSPLLVPTLQNQLKWKHFGLFQASTGRLNVTTDYWQAAAPSQVPALRKTWPSEGDVPGPGPTFLETEAAHATETAAHATETAAHAAAKAATARKEPPWHERIAGELAGLQIAEWRDVLEVYRVRP